MGEFYTTYLLALLPVMVGDVNIFFNDPDSDPTFGEIEVMIAEPDFRRSGRGREALEIIMGYGK